MSDNFKYYGFYGRKGKTDEINYRPGRQKGSSDPQVNYKEFGVYVHTENPDIPKHLEIEYSNRGEYGEHYGNVKNLTFVPVHNLIDKLEITKIQDLIDISYKYFVDVSGDQISWAKMHALGREYMYSGYDSKLSKKIIDLIADEANNIKDNTNLDDNQKKNLDIQSKRTCESLHEIDFLKKEKTQDYNKILLEDYILKEGEKQLILGFGKKDTEDITSFEKNPYAYNDPWLSRSTGLGFFVWNMMINKASIKCILDNSKTLFPMQIILSTNPNYLFYEQIDINNENIKYIGYFIARINYDDKIDQPKKMQECKRLYNYKFDKGPKSQEQYFVIFVFKNLNSNVNYDLDKYILTDFRLQRIHWGNLTRSKRVLFIEIQQLMCSLLNKNTKGEETYFYLLSEYETGQNEPINKICKSQKEEKEQNKDDKIKNKDCYQAWLHSSTIAKLNEKKIKLIGSSYKIFVAKKNLKDINKELTKRNEDNKNVTFFLPEDKSLEHLIITESNTPKEYILFPCHFKWEDIANNVKDKKYNTKKTFVLKHGYLNLDKTKLARDDPKYFNSEQYYKEELCLEGDCIFDRDYIMHTYKHTKIYKTDSEVIPDNYNGITDKLNNTFVQQIGGNNNYNKLFKLLKKIKLYKLNFKNIIYSNKTFYLENLNNFDRFFGFNLKHIFNNDKIIDKYIFKSEVTTELLPIIKHIINGNILIISDNLNMLVTCKKYLNNESFNITLIIINININNFKYIYTTLNKLNKNIKIYYFGNLIKVELINNIIKSFNNIKFNNIIVDIVDDNNQDFYNILGLRLCTKLLINKGSFIQYNKLPNIKDNLTYIYYLIFKCFKYNTFENYTFFLLKDNMYSLIFHKVFEYNLNDEEENILNNILNQDISKKTNLLINLPFNQLFNDFLYIKFLTINYNLYNFIEQIFKKSYNILENKINEQQGGYQISNISKLDYYDSKYTCTFLEKHLFLLHLNFLTKVYLYENKNLDNFYIYYDIITAEASHGADDNESYRFYQEILKNMFKQLTWTNKQIKNKECIFISNNLDMYHKIKPKYALMDLKPDTDNNFFDGEILYTLYPFSNTDFKILVKEYNKIKKYSDNIFQELIDNNKFLSLCYNNDIYNINKVIPIKYLKLIP
jgi:hypothetical protein